MQLVERHIIKYKHKYYKECDSLSFKSKNLYNSCLYTIKKSYKDNGIWVVHSLHKLMKDTEQYKDLPAKVSSAVLLMVEKNFKSYFKANNEYQKNPNNFKAKPQLPKFLDKTNGRFVCSYTNQAISKKVFKSTHKVKLSKTNIEINTKIKEFKDIDCARIIPRNDQYIIEIVYTIPDKELLPDNNAYLSIDLGVNNLATLTSNLKKYKPIIINGKPLKSINQYYNKKLSYYESILERVNKNKKSRRINKLTNKRTNKVDNYLHKASKAIIKIAKDSSINAIVIGKNDGWKQEVSMTKRNNQNFVNIPHSRFINMIKYKCEIEGINIILQEESYTSKASFIDLDYIPTYTKDNNENYKFNGKRICRGLYKTVNNKIINADVNGSYNILRKAIPNVFTNGIEDMGVYPIVFTIKK